MSKSTLDLHPHSSDALANDAFVREGLCGDGPFAASSMPVEVAELII
jgi:hypothetical protein